MVWCRRCVSKVMYQVLPTNPRSVIQIQVGCLSFPRLFQLGSEILMKNLQRMLLR